MAFVLSSEHYALAAGARGTSSLVACRTREFDLVAGDDTQAVVIDIDVPVCGDRASFYGTLMRVCLHCSPTTD
jgi:hypothetical protein